MRNRHSSGVIGSSTRLYGPTRRRPEERDRVVEFSVGGTVWYVEYSGAVLSVELRSEVEAWGRKRVSLYEKRDALRTSAMAVQEGKLHPNELFVHLVSVVSETYQLMGLSESAMKYVLIRASNVLWSSVKHELEPFDVYLELQTVEKWILEVARTSRAFRIRYTDKIPNSEGRKLPLLESLMVKYHYDKVEPPKAKTESKSTDPIFYPGPPDPIGGCRPWLSRKNSRARW
ncbi:MAG: hypothetical protein Q7S40_06440 [Opitutaceae bacterium]|nr:hypothetical protein [Opitutaceae bacterium]